MAEQKETINLENCPRCGYSLQGLPSEHNCPECGLEIDLRWKMFGTSTAIRKRKSPLPLLKVFFGINLLIQLFFLMKTIESMAKGVNTPWIFGISVLSIVLMILLLIRSRRSLSFVGVGPAGIAVYEESLGLQKYGWHEFQKARCSFKRQTEIVKIEDQIAKINIGPLFGNNIWEAESCTYYINRFTDREYPETNK